jgi:hypothetical protein
MWLRSSPTTDVSNSIISYNSGGYGIHNQGTLMVEYTDFYGNESGAIAGTVPSGFGVFDRVNYNGDSCDCYYDIFMDPMFVDTANNDYHLTEFSPCVDAGDPAFALDPDSTITDMGRYWYDQTGVADYPVTKYKEHAYIGATIFAGPMIPPRGKNCKIFDITGRQTKNVNPPPGVYFMELDGEIKQKIIKVK